MSFFLLLCRKHIKIVVKCLKILYKRCILVSVRVDESKKCEENNYEQLQLFVRFGNYFVIHESVGPFDEEGPDAAGRRGASGGSDSRTGRVWNLE
ncbi:hypothetical protein GCM10008910_34900 [Faecalicatena orotica]